MASLVPSRRQNVAAGLALVGAVFAAYALSLRGDFLWDDDLHVTANPTIIGPLGLREIWTSARANYFPAVLTNFWLQHEVWGLNPLGYHVVTVGCHAVAAVLLWRVLLALGVRGAWLGAALWALHPVQVESVAWICELKNTQSAVFFLAAILCWVRWIEAGSTAGRRRAPYAFGLVCAVLALLSKPSTVMLPVALLLCSGWVRRRWDPRDFLALLPFFALSAIAAGWTIWEQKHHSGALGPEWSQTFSERVIIAGRAIWFYLGKLVWPEPLIFIYPRWRLHATEVLAYVPALAALVVLGVLTWRSRRTLSPGAFAALNFVALLFPVLGFFSVYFFRYSFVGDHFQYLASMAPLGLTGAALASGWDRAGWEASAPEQGARSREQERMFLLGSRVAAVALVVTCGALTARQSLAYRNNIALWRDTLAKNPEATMAWLNLADTYAQAKRYEESLITYRRALQLAPRDPDGWNDLGNVLVMLGRPADAVGHFERALELKPDFVEAHSNFGNALRLLGRSEEAVAHYRRALELKPEHVEALNNLGAELAESGRPEEAAPLFERALRLNPNHPGAHDNFALTLRALRRFDEALAQHAESIRLQPNSAEAEANFARTLVAIGRTSEALPHFERALALKPTFALARGNYALALAALGRQADALGQLEKAVELSPDSAQAHQNLGAALAQSGRVDEAIEQFQRAVQLAPRLVLARVSLATALGSRGRWREAIPQLRAALDQDPRNVEAQTALAVALVNTEQLAAAVPVFEQAIRLNPGSAELHDNFAQVLRALGRTREAFEHFERAADLRRQRQR